MALSPIRSSARKSARPAETRSKSSTTRRCVHARGKHRSVSSSTMQRTSATLPVVRQYWRRSLRPRQGWKGCVTSTQSSDSKAATPCSRPACGKGDSPDRGNDDAGSFALGNLR